MINASEREPVAGPPPPPHKEAETGAAPMPFSEGAAAKFPIVGLGASAGGLEALTRLLEAVPSDCGLALVIMHHADADQESLVVELLSKHTAMPIAFARDGEVVAPNHVYVIAANSFLAVENGALRLSPPVTGHRARQFAENIINTVREPLIVLDREFHVRAASASYWKAFGIKPEDTKGRFIFGLDRWEIPKLRELILQVIHDKIAVDDFELEYDFPQLGRRILLFNARPIQNSEDIGLCLLAIEDVTQRRTAERTLIEREAHLRAVLATAPDGIITIDENGIIGTFSAAAEHLFGFTAAEMVGNSVSVLMPELQRSAHDSYLSQYLKAGEARIVGRGRELTGQRKDGTKIPLRLSVAEMESPGRRMFVGIVHDLSEEKKRSEELLQAQKMEALGQLAGGVAHDFNNLLTIIMGNNERIQAGAEGDDLRKLLAQNDSAADRGAMLARRLLSFAHRNRLEPVALRLNDHVGSMVEILHRTIGETIAVTSVMAPDLWQVQIDPGEFGNALLNLVLNARDGMPNGGKISIETANASFGAGEAPAGLAPGDYVRLSVVNNGVGMTPEVLKRAGEPFFTTKPPGKGTGLGLASTYGFAKQSGGHLTIASEAGNGTTVSLYLPRAAEEVPLPTASLENPDMPLGNGELVLVVNDDDEVREVTLKRLESLGYAVIDAGNGPEAVERCRLDAPIALALIDIVMPGGMSGYEVADAVRKLNPDIRVLLTSGYGGDAWEEAPGTPGDLAVLYKPYSRAELAQAIAKALAG